MVIHDRFPNQFASLHEDDDLMEEGALPDDPTLTDGGLIPDDELVATGDPLQEEDDLLGADGLLGGSEEEDAHTFDGAELGLDD